MTGPAGGEAKVYPGLGAREGSALGDGNVEGRLSRMEQLVALEGDALLDVGCGNGAYTIRLAEGFGRTVGIDVEPDRLGDFRARCHDPSIEVVQGSAADTGLEPASFDVVTAIETVEHLGSLLPAVIAEAHRVLRPGGALVITTPNRWWPFEQHGWLWRGRWRAGWTFPFLTWVPALHRRFSDAAVFTPRQLDELIEPLGFRSVGVRRMMPPLDRRPGLRRVLGPVLRRLERPPMGGIAQTLVVAYRKPATTGA